LNVQQKSEAILDIIRKWSAQHKLEVPSDTSMTFDDAGFDSLHSTELAFFLEDELGVPVDETVIWEKATFDSLVQYLAEKSGAVKLESPAGDEQTTGEGGGW
jgi:acyl carrier protein